MNQILFISAMFILKEIKGPGQHIKIIYLCVLQYHNNEL